MSVLPFPNWLILITCRVIEVAAALPSAADQAMDFAQILDPAVIIVRVFARVVLCVVAR